MAFLGSSASDDTWEFDGTRWRLVSDSSPARLGPELVYNAARGTVMVVGREAYLQPVKLWEWDGDSWREVAVPATLPSTQNFDPLITYDSTHDRLICLPEKFTPFGGTYEFGDGRWRALAAYAPTVLGDNIAYDPVRDRVIMLCGGSGFCPDDHQWTEFDGQVWSLPISANNPQRSGTRLVYHEDRDTFVMFSGAWRCGTYTEFVQDTWEWDRQSWTPVGPSRPRARNSFVTAFDEARSSLVVYGGNLSSPCSNPEGCLPIDVSETWEWDPAGWRRGPNGPGQNLRHAIAYDSTMARSVYVGSRTAGETWQYDGAWKTLATDPPCCWDSSVPFAVDPERGRAVLVTQYGSPKVHELVADSWAEVVPVGDPTPPRFGAAMAFDPVRHELLLFGGQSGGGYTNDMWYWNGQRWALHVPPGPVPPARQGARLATDTARGVIMLVGGSAATSFYDTWEWDGVRWTQGGQGGWQLGGPPVYNASTASFMRFAGDSIWEWVPGHEPRFDESPESVSVPLGSKAVLTCAVDSTDAVTLAWRKGGLALDGNGRIRGTKTMRLVIDAVVPGDAGGYDVVCTSACGSATSAAATLTVLCPSDFNMDGFVTGDDFDGFVSAFVLGGSGADFDHNAFVNGDDFDAFVLSFSAGC